MDAILVLGWIAPNFTLSAASAQRISAVGEPNSARVAACADSWMRRHENSQSRDPL